MQLVHCKKIPASVVKRAERVLASRPARRTSYLGFLTKEVGVHWRLLSTDNGKTWRVLSHENYSKLLDRRV